MSHYLLCLFCHRYLSCFMYHSHAWPLIVPACTRLHNTPCRFFFLIHLSCPPFRHHQAQGIIQRSSYPLFIAQIPFPLLNAFSLHLHTRTRIVLHRAINPTNLCRLFLIVQLWADTICAMFGIHVYSLQYNEQSLYIHKLSLSLSPLFFRTVMASSPVYSMYSICCVSSDAYSSGAPSYTAGIK